MPTPNTPSYIKYNTVGTTHIEVQTAENLFAVSEDVTAGASLDQNGECNILRRPEKKENKILHC